MSEMLTCPSCGERTIALITLDDVQEGAGMTKRMMCLKCVQRLYNEAEEEQSKSTSDSEP